MISITVACRFKGFSFPSPIGHLFKKNHDTQKKKKPFKNDIMQKIHGCLIIFNLLPDMSLRNIQREIITNFHKERNCQRVYLQLCISNLSLGRFAQRLEQWLVTPNALGSSPKSDFSLSPC